MKKTVLIVDGNNVAYGAYSIYKRSPGGLLTSSTGIPTSVFFGMLNTLGSFTKKHTVDRAVICWDVGGGSKWRKKLFPDYKGNRKGSYDDMDDYFAELDSAKEYLASIGIRQAPVKGIEADDVIGWLANKYQRKGWNVIIFSNDKDYYQVLNEHISVWRPCMDKMVDHLQVPEQEIACGLEPKYLHRLQGLVGQQKDNIPGPCDLDKEGVMIKWGFGPAYAMKLLNHEDNPKHSMRVCKTLLTKDGPLSEAKNAQLLRNWKQVLLSVKLSKVRKLDKEYERGELVKLKVAYKDTISKEVFTVGQMNQVARLLDVNKVSVPRVCRALGVRMKGKITSHTTTKRVKL